MIALAGVATTVGAGGASVVSRALGEANTEKASRTVANTFLIFWTMATVITVFGVILTHYWGIKEEKVMTENNHPSCTYPTTGTPTHLGRALSHQKVGKAIFHATSEIALPPQEWHTPAPKTVAARFPMTYGASYDYKTLLRAILFPSHFSFRDDSAPFLEA